jgi:hypothetical protein|tara:strand:- start:580 stop:849 length:270 start_codon:yes stop_codon:yes gene_type:complete
MAQGTQLTPVRLPKKYADLVPFLETFQRDVVGSVETKADDAQVAADAAGTKADAAQVAADLSLSEVAALAIQNAADLKKANFLRQWYGS